MKRYVLHRVALAVPTLFLVSVIVFAMMRLMPADVATRMVERHADAPTLDALRKDLGLDRVRARRARGEHENGDDGHAPHRVPPRGSIAW